MVKISLRYKSRVEFASYLMNQTLRRGVLFGV
jgi:hypothetical protein